MKDKLIVTEQKGTTGIISINNPEKKNAVNNDMLKIMGDEILKMEADGLRAVIIKGTGDKIFCSGYDISSFPKIASDIMNGNSELEKHDNLRMTLRSFRDIGVPIIAMINGHCIGAGVDIAGACDFRYAAAGIKIKLPPARLGIVYNPEGIRRMINIVGLARAKEMFFLAQNITAEDAYSMGFLNKVLPSAELEDHVLGICDIIADNAPLSIKGMKKVFKYCLEHQDLSKERNDDTAGLILKAMNSEDAIEAFISFMEKRKPVFKGK